MRSSVVGLVLALLPLIAAPRAYGQGASKIKEITVGPGTDPKTLVITCKIDVDPNWNFAAASVSYWAAGGAGQVVTTDISRDGTGLCTITIKDLPSGTVYFAYVQARFVEKANASNSVTLFGDVGNGPVK